MSGAVVRQLALTETGRLWRHPLLYLGLGLSALLPWLLLRQPEQWSGSWYTSVPVASGPVCVAVATIVAGGFHRERSGLAGDAPVREPVRALGRLLGAATVVPLVALLVTLGAWWLHRSGGFTLGNEPGRTLEAEYSVTELLQYPALVVLAIASGAAVGRRLPHLASGVLLLTLTWLPVTLVSWAFQHPLVTPFSIVQVQPISVDVGPPVSDPLAYPDGWLLSAPNEYQDHWARLFTSVPLGAWHDAWLLGLASVLLGVAVPGRARPVLLGGGVLIALVAVVAQHRVIP